MELNTRHNLNCTSVVYFQHSPMFATLSFLHPHVPSISCSINQNSPNNNNNPNHQNPRLSHTKHNDSTSIRKPKNAIKMPAAPWMKSPILLQPNEVLNPLKPKHRNSDNKDAKKVDNALMSKEKRLRGKHAMRKIVQSVEKLKERSDFDDAHMDEMRKFDQSVEQLKERIDFEDAQIEKLKERSDFEDAQLHATIKVVRSVENLKERSDFEEAQMKFEDNEIGSLLDKIGGVDDDEDLKGRRMPWMRDERFVFRRVKKERVVSKAELELDEKLLVRLRREAAEMRKWVKVKKAGVTQAVVDEIMDTWRSSELAMVRFDVPLCRNMDRAREILELKTGGFVVRSWKNFVVIYRGNNYQPPPETTMRPASSHTLSPNLSDGSLQNNINASEEKPFASANITMSNMVGKEESPISFNVGSESVDGSLYEREADRLLDGLGPRYVDWWMQKPLPVDADLLPAEVPSFMPPVRLCPPKSRSKLTDDELTYLRKLAKCLPTHFVLGRNRKLQGLASSILKLWEKSLIAKIAVKWGSPNTDHKQMAYELKCLTGGVLILCNKYFIIFYRGKNFLPGGVASLVDKKEVELGRFQNHEEAARLGAVEPIDLTNESLAKSSTSGTLSEFQDIQMEFGDLGKGKREAELQQDAEIEGLQRELKKQEHKLLILKTKIEKSEEELSKLNSSWRPAEQDLDQEMMTEEERVCLRKIGLKMSSSLVLGRRGVYDGVLEGLHQHWKHREVVNVITMQKAYSQVLYTAKMLEAESGGILVSVDKLKEGHAIIICRGRNYKRPMKLVKENLLSKRKALDRSLEMQRLGSLRFFAHQRQQALSELKQKLAELQKKEDRF